MSAPDAARSPGVSGLRVLVIEDELLLAMDYEEILADAGCTVLGPVARQSQALSLLEQERPDAAVLDLNLAGERSTRLAEALTERGVPFVVVTGYGGKTVPEPVLAHAPQLEKPVNAHALVRAIAAVARPG